MMETHVSLGVRYLLLQLDPVMVNPACFMAWNGCLRRSVSALLSFWAFWHVNCSFFLANLEKYLLKCEFSYVFQLSRGSTFYSGPDTLKESYYFACLINPVMKIR